MSTESANIPFHPFNPMDFSQPYEKLRLARKECPVGEFPVEGFPAPFYFLAQDVDVRELLNSSAVSNHGNFELSKDYPPVITQLDGEEHKHLRNILEESFNAQVFKQAQPFIVRKTAELLSSMLEQEKSQADFIDALAGKLPTAAITYLIGVPESDAERIREWNVVIHSRIPGPFYDTDAWKHFEGYIRGLVAGYQMAERAPDNIISRLLTTDLSSEEILMTVFQLLIAGAETTTMLLGSLLYELLRAPERWEALKKDQSLITPAIEETLRLHPPLNWVMRSCPSPLATHEETLPTGSRLVLGITSANRDEARWGDSAEDFEIGRRGSANHLTFGAGLHFCLGSQLARLIARVVLETLVERVPTLHLAEEYKYEPMDGAMIHGPKALLVQWS